MIWNIKKKKAFNQNSKKKKNKTWKDKLRSLWDNLKSTNIHLMGVPEEEKNKKLETYLKI